jgi:hypothetical protein
VDRAGVDDGGSRVARPIPYLACGSKECSIGRWRRAFLRNWNRSIRSRPIQFSGASMTPLRQRMIEDMRLRNLTPATQRSYLHYVTDFAQYFNLSPEKLDADAIHQFLVHEVEERKLSPEP